MELILRLKAERAGKEAPQAAQTHHRPRPCAEFCLRNAHELHRLRCLGSAARHHAKLGLKILCCLLFLQA